MLSCLGYPQCRAVQFFPRSVLEADRHDSCCESVSREVQWKLDSDSLWSDFLCWWNLDDSSSSRIQVVVARIVIENFPLCCFMLT